MSLALTLDATTEELDSRVALIACGTRPGKTIACASCREKTPALRRIASTGAQDALAAAICGYARGGACEGCKAKASQILTVCGVSA